MWQENNPLLPKLYVEKIQDMSAVLTFRDTEKPQVFRTIDGGTQENDYRTQFSP